MAISTETLKLRPEHVYEFARWLYLDGDYHPNMSTPPQEYVERLKGYFDTVAKQHEMRVGITYKHDSLCNDICPVESREACRGLGKASDRKVNDGFVRLLGLHKTSYSMGELISHLREVTSLFLESGYDALNVLPEHRTKPAWE